MLLKRYDVPGSCVESLCDHVRLGGLGRDLPWSRDTKYKINSTINDRSRNKVRGENFSLTVDNKKNSKEWSSQKKILIRGLRSIYSIYSEL